METQVEIERQNAWGRLLSPWYISVSVGLFMIWAVALGFAGWWVWINGTQLGNATLSYLLIAALSGALVGLAKAVRELQIFISHAWLSTKDASKIQFPNSPINNLIVKPLLWPLPGAVFGLVLAAIFVDAGTGHVKVMLLGLVGGILWRTILQKLPGMFDIAGDK